MPATSHWQTDVMIASERPHSDFYYAYLLLEPQTDYPTLTQQLRESLSKEQGRTLTTVELMPLTKIHLHSHLDRELQPNGNITFIYLLIGANLLLLIIVLFNIWLNASIVCSYNRRYYQLLRFNGASSWQIIKDEGRISLLLVLVSMILGSVLAALFVYCYQSWGLYINCLSLIGFVILFFAVTLFVSLLPLLVNLSTNLLLSTKLDMRLKGISKAQTSVMLVIQFAIVIFILVVGLGIDRQMQLVQQSQLANRQLQIVTIAEQPGEIIENFERLKTELESHPQIELVSAAMQLPGENVRDMITVKQASGETMSLPLLAVGEDFSSFFDLQFLAGTDFPRSNLSYNEETKDFNNSMSGVQSDKTQPVIVNRKALLQLGYTSPSEAVGQEITLMHPLAYGQKQYIVGVVEDFTYTNVFEAQIPMIIMQTSMFSNCFMVRFTDGNNPRNVDILNEVWHKVNPTFALNYSYLHDVYNSVYSNELIAQQTIKGFALLCILVTLLGLIVFMSFIVRIRSREIGVRKVNGATIRQIVALLNVSVIRWIAIACVPAIPFSIWIMYLWMSHFAYTSPLAFYHYIAIMIIVILFTTLAISIQSWRAARVNLVEVLKGE